MDTAVEACLMQMGAAFAQEGNVVQYDEVFAIQTCAKLSIVNGVHISTEFLNSTSVEIINEKLLNIIKCLETKMAESFGKLVPYSIHFDSLEDENKIPNIYEYLVENLDSNCNSKLSTHFTLVFKSESTFNVNLSKLSFQKITSEKDKDLYLVFMQDIFGFSRDPVEIGKIKEILFLPTKLEENNLLEWNYENYFAYLDGEPVCIGRIVQLSPKYLRKNFPSLSGLCDRLESNTEIGEKFYAIFAIGTQEKFRSQGLGSSMTKFLIHRVRELGGNAVGLQAGRKVVPFYEKIGFEVVGSQKLIYRIPNS